MTGETSLNLMLWKRAAPSAEKGCFRKNGCAKGQLERSSISWMIESYQVLVALRRIGEKKLGDDERGEMGIGKWELVNGTGD
jgi:hypothetical protein